MSASPPSVVSPSPSSGVSSALPVFASKLALKSAIVEAIRAERARKATRRVAGLPETESSDDDTDTDGTGQATKQQQKTTSAPANSTVGDSILSKNEYGVAEYWNHRYAKTRGMFDWYVDYAHLQPILDAYGQRAFDAIHAPQPPAATDAQKEDQAEAAVGVTSSSATAATATASESDSASVPSSSGSSFARSRLHLLDIGCGNSGLGEQLYRAGWTAQTHIDISDVVIRRMRDQYADAPHRYGEWVTMDATRMTFPARHFDLLLEKGTIDALDCTPDEDAVVAAILAECARVLKPGGVLLVITHGAPRRRLPALLHPSLGWDVETRAIGYSDSALFIRLLRKKLQGRPLASASPVLMAECAGEVRETKKQMADELVRARACIHRVEAEFAATAAGLAPGHDHDDGDVDEEEEAAAATTTTAADQLKASHEAEIFSPATSSICFVYACIKRTQSTTRAASEEVPPGEEAASTV